MSKICMKFLYPFVNYFIESLFSGWSKRSSYWLNKRYMFFIFTRLIPTSFCFWSLKLGRNFLEDNYCTWYYSNCWFLIKLLPCSNAQSTSNCNLASCLSSLGNLLSTFLYLMIMACFWRYLFKTLLRGVFRNGAFHSVTIC